jgi:hypothetical protein
MALRPEDHRRWESGMIDAGVWVAIFFLGLLCLNWPLLEIFHDAQFAYLLSFWLLFVLLVARAARGRKAPPAA